MTSAPSRSGNGGNRSAGERAPKGFKRLSEKPRTGVSGGKIPPSAAQRLSAPFGKGGGEGAAEQGIYRAQQSHEIESYSDRFLIKPQKIPIDCNGDGVYFLSFLITG
jgi:hypothetical protein